MVKAAWPRKAVAMAPNHLAKRRFTVYISPLAHSNGVMRHVRSVMKWTCVFGFLAGVAATTFFFVRHLPRATIRGKLSPRYLSADGSRLLTLTENPIQSKGPLQIWDTHTGRAIHRLFDHKPVAALDLSPDGRRGAVVLGDESLWVFDWQAGDAWRIEEVHPRLSPYPGMEQLRIAPAGCLQFSPKGQWLVVRDHTFYGTTIVSASRPTVIRKFAMQGLEGFDSNDLYAFMEQRWSVGPIIVQLETGKYVHENRAGGRFQLASPDGNLLAFESSIWDHSRKPPDLPATRFLDARLIQPPSMPPAPPAKTQEERMMQEMRAFAARPHFERRFDVAHPICDEVVDKQPYRRKRLFSPDSRYFASWMNDYPRVHPVEIFEMAHGKRVASLSIQCVRDAGFSADGELFWFVHGAGHVLSVIDVATGDELWRRPGTSVVHFCHATGAIVHGVDGFDEILDVRTGAVRAQAPSNFSTFERRPQFTPDGRRFAIGGTKQRDRVPTRLEDWLEPWLPQVFGLPTGFIVMDTATGREAFRVLNFDAVARLSDDGTTLATWNVQDDVTVIRVWDVDATRAWRWAVGAFLLAALGLWLTKRTWRWCRSGRVTTSPHTAHSTTPPRPAPSPGPRAAPG